MTTCSSILAWKISWTEEPDGVPWGHKESDTSECVHTHTHTHTQTHTHTCLLLTARELVNAVSAWEPLLGCKSVGGKERTNSQGFLSNTALFGLLVQQERSIHGALIMSHSCSKSLTDPHYLKH